MGIFCTSRRFRVCIGHEIAASKPREELIFKSFAILVYVIKKFRCVKEEQNAFGN